MAIYIKVDEEKIITARLTDAAGNVVSSADLTWSSLSSAVASVRESTAGSGDRKQTRAILKGITPGSTTISCTDGSVTGNVTVTVYSGAITDIAISD